MTHSYHFVSGAMLPVNNTKTLSAAISANFIAFHMLFITRINNCYAPIVFPKPIILSHKYNCQWEF
jgi:hypothetical protein